MPTIALEQQLTAALQKHAVFTFLEPSALAELAREMEMLSYSLGESIVAQGDAGDCAYLIYVGRVRVFTEGPDGKAITLTTLGGGDLFGEHAILQDETRTASVRASDDCVLFRIPRFVFQKLLREQPSLTPYLERLQRQRALHRFLQLATILGAVPGRQVLALLDQVEECKFPTGHVVCREGEPGDRMYIVHAGSAKVMKGEPGRETVLLYLGPSDYFGERALILDEPRYASVVAMTDLSCYSLSRDAYASLKDSAPQLHEQLTRRLEQYPLAEEMARKFGARPPTHAETASPTPAVVEEKLAGPPTSPPPTPSPRTWLGLPRPFPFVPQEDETDCGAAALAMIARYHNVPVSVDWLRDVSHVGSEGASLLSLTKAAEALGFQWRAVTTDLGHLGGLTFPAIAHWKGYHYLVLVSCTPDQIVLADPALGLVKMTPREFTTHWTGSLLLLTPTPDLGRNVPTRTVGQSLRALLAPVRTNLIALVLAAVVVALVQIVFPLLTERLVDHAFDRTESGLPWALGAGLLIAALGLYAALLMRGQLVVRFLNQVSCSMTAAWFERLLLLPWRYVQSRPVGRLLANLESSNSVRSEMARLTLTMLLDGFVVLTGLSVLACYNVALAIVVALAWLVVVGLLRRFGASPEADAQLAPTRTAWVEAIQAHAAIKDAGAETERGEKHRSLMTTPDKPLKYFPLAPWVATVFTITGVFVIWYGAHLVAEVRLTIGQLVALQSIFCLMAVPLLGIARLGPTFSALGRYLRTLAENEALPPEQEPGKPRVALPRLRGSIRLDGVAYRPSPESRDLVSNINLEVQPGQIVWLVGRSGAGKSTLARLLQRLIAPTAGKLTFDGVDLGDAELRSLRRQVSVVAEEPALLDGTIRDNIALAEPGAVLDRVIGTAKLACAHDFIMRLPRAYDTVLGPLGVQLSHSQRQALALARGLLKDPRVLILDEATSALDAETERAVLKNLRWLAIDRTVLILSRRPLASQPNDIVVVLEDGQIVDRGTHGQLLTQPGLYSYLTGG